MSNTRQRVAPKGANALLRKTGLLAASHGKKMRSAGVVAWRRNTDRLNLDEACVLGAQQIGVLAARTE